MAKVEGTPDLARSRESRPGRVRLTAAWAIWFALLFGAWVALVGTTVWLELLGGACAAAIGATAQQVVRARGVLDYRLDPAWIARAWRLPWKVAVEFLVAVRVLLLAAVRRERPRGAFRVLDFDVGGTDRASGGRRATASVLASVAPNTYVVGFDGDQRAVLVHDLDPRHARGRELL